MKYSENVIDNPCIRCGWFNGVGSFCFESPLHIGVENPHEYTCSRFNGYGNGNIETLQMLDGPETNLEDFLDWTADRLVFLHGESPNVDYVLSLRKRAETARKMSNV